METSPERRSVAPSVEAEEAIVRAIDNGDVGPGQRLLVKDWASAHGVRPDRLTAIFERLEAQGLVQSTGEGGQRRWFVAGADPEPVSRVDRAEAAISRRIYDGELTPGQRITLREFAEQLGSSPRTIRKAFERLENTDPPLIACDRAGKDGRYSVARGAPRPEFVERIRHRIKSGELPPNRLLLRKRLAEAEEPPETLETVDEALGSLAEDGLVERRGEYFYVADHGDAPSQERR